MEKIQADTDSYILYSPDTLKYITDHMFDILDKKIEEYKSLFGITEFRKVEIYFFDDKEKFREYVYNIRGERNSLPAYAAGVFDEGKIITYTPPNLVVGSARYHNALYVAAHELFHIMYLELILKNDIPKRIIWYDEGMAKLLSGESSSLEDEEVFKSFFEGVKSKTKVLPNLNEISHGTSFCNDDYNGYDLSLLAVHYLREKLTDEEFKSLLGDFDRIHEYGSTILEEMMNYYTEKFTTK